MEDLSNYERYQQRSKMPRTQNMWNIKHPETLYIQQLNFNYFILKKQSHEKNYFTH